MLTKRDFLGNEAWIAFRQDEDLLLSFRRQVSERAAAGQKPTAEELSQMALNKIWLAFYAKILYDRPSNKQQ